MNIQLIDEFVLDWKLLGKAVASVDAYAKDLTEFFTQTPEQTRSQRENLKP